MKIICIHHGNQGGPAPVVIGNTYTVVDYSYGWEMMHTKSADIFYQLAECPEDIRYWSGLFTELNSNSELNEAVLAIDTTTINNQTITK
jgi:hypothetical protein